MRLFGRRPAPQRPPTPMQVLRADGQRIDLTSRTVGQRLVAVRQPWQADAWDYRDMIGELRYSHRLLARSVARVRFYAAELCDYPDDPAELTGTDHKLDKQLAADAVANLARLPLDDDPDGFVAALTENLATTGEAWVHGEPDGDGERWTVRSVSEILTSGDRVMLAELPGSSAAGQRPIDPRTEELLRCWIRHPRWGQLADSPLRAMLDVLEEIVLTGREVRAAARSRIAANGILLIPNELSLLLERTDDDDPDEQDVTSDKFMVDLAAAITAPIRDEGHAQAVVPLVLRGAGEHLKEVRHLTMVRADAETLLARLNGALLRMLHGLDVQPEQVEGMGGLNHWGGWQVEANSVKHQVEPAAAVVAGVLTKAFLRSSLTALDHDPEQVRRIVVHYDISGLVENPNRGQDAREAHDRLVISDGRLRQDLGYDEEDAPNEEELQRRIAAKSGVDQGTSAIVLELGRALQQAHATRPAPQVIDVDTQPRELPSGGQDGARPAGPGQTVPERRAPAEPDAVTAAASPADGWRVDVDLAHALAGIDAALVERILVAADAAVARAVERAGGRARNAVRRDRALAASVEGMEPALMAAAIGREQLVAFASVADLLADSYTRLRGQVRGWLAEARAAVADAVLRMLGVPRRSQQGQAVHERITGRLAVHEEAALTALTEALDAAAEQALFRADPLGPDPDQRGETTDTLISPAAVARAVAAAGGGHPGQASPTGMSTGPVVADLLSGEGAVLLGWEWQYRPERLRTPFPPHVALDGTRFATWTDPKLDTDESSAWVGAFFRPGDHQGCFVAGTEVSGPSAVGSFVRPYTGDGVQIRTEAGKLLTGTPNHPILTPSGWVPLGELGEGDEVVVACGSEQSSVVDDEAHQVPALIEDVAATLPMASSVATRPVPTAPEDFHGDGAGSDGQVTVVRADRRLLLNDQAAPAEFSDDDVLQLGDERAGALATERALPPRLGTEGLAAQGGVGCGSEGPSVLGGAPDISVDHRIAAASGCDASTQEHLADDAARTAVVAGEREFAGSVAVGLDDRSSGGLVPAGRRGDPVLGEEAADGGWARPEPRTEVADEHALGAQPQEFGEVGVLDAPALRDAVLSQDALDGPVIDAVPPLEVLDRLAGGVATEKVVDIVRHPLDCHVYNLSTTTGWYVANGVIVHNCRCYAAPIWAVPELDDGIVARRLREAGQRHADTDRLAEGDTAAGRAGTTAQNEVEVRQRITTAVEQLRRQHIEQEAS